jgi:uncharacterized membrane protein YgcG
MSPARSKRQPVPHRHSRSEIVKAVSVGAGIAAVTALLVFLLRPGPPGIPATGGIMNRQPRASWLIFVAISVAAFAAWFILFRGRRTRARAKMLVPIALGVVLVLTVAGGVMWPGGLLRHDVAPKPQPPPTTTTTKPGATTTTAAGSSTTRAPSGGTSTGGVTGGTGGTGTGGAPGNAPTSTPTTAVPASTAPAATTPTTGSK